MSTLSDKILSYSPEQYIRFNEAYTLTPTNLGSGGTGTFTLTAEAPIFDATGGPKNEGAWNFNWGGLSDTTPTRYRIISTSSPTVSPEITDGSFSYGFWFKFTTPNAGNSMSSANYTFTTLTSKGYTAGAGIAGSGGGAGKFFNGATSTGVVQYSSARIDDGAWHYYAFRMNETSSGVADIQTYLDGALFTEVIGKTFSPTTSVALTLGALSAASIAADIGKLQISDLYIAPYATIDGTAISQIWTTGITGATNVSVLADVTTASATITESSTSGSVNVIATAFSIDPVGIEPTVVTTTSSSVNIATSIPVDAYMVSPIPSLSLTVDIGTTLNASAESVDPVFGISAPVYIYETPATASVTLPESITVISDNQVAIFATAYEVSATIVNASVISDDEVIVYADRMAASSEFPLPGFGTPQPDPLYWTPGTLQSKIATYAIQDGTEFNYNGTSTALIPSYGTLPSGWTSYNTFDSAGYTPIYDATDGPYASGTGCWKLANSRLRTTLQSGITSDLNYTTGIWFKLPTLPTGTANEGMRLFTLGTSTPASTSLDYSVNVTGSSHATQPSKLAISLNGTSYDYLTTTLNTTDWYYLAIKRTGSAGVNNFEVYINGELKLVKTNSDTSATYTYFHIGNNSVSANGGSIKFQNFHAATAATLTSYEINQIWLAGTLFPPAATINVSHAADRFLATALATSPTIIATKGDHVEVTTSVTVSSEFPEPGWSTGEIVRINVGSLGTLLADIGDNVQIETNGDKTITPEALTASALFVEPILSRQPAKATASLPMPNVYTAPNYFALVMAHDPVFYIEDGQESPVNYGSWQQTSFETNYVSTVQSGLEMNAVGNQKSWIGDSKGIILHSPTLQADIPDYRTKINDLYATRNLTIEAWYTSVGRGSTVNRLDYEESGPIFNDGITQITEVWDWFGCVPGSDPQLKIMLIGERLKNYEFNTADDFATWRSFPDANPKKDQWNHLVVTYEPVTNPQQVRRKIYLNAGIISNQLLTIANSSINPSGEAFEDEGYIDISLDQPQNIWSGPMLGGGIQLSGSQEIKWEDGVKKDEFAIYPKALSGTQVTEHYNFIKSLSPNAVYNATAIDFLVSVGNHQVIPVQNALYDEDPMPALAARIPEPVIIAGKSKTLVLDTFDSDALLVNPAIITQSIHYVEPMIGNANLERVYVANNQYYNYVKTIPNLHRYYSFDTAQPFTNHGSDTIYSVEDITLDGEIVQYGQSINNKSAMTYGLNPETDGVILYESQHDDSWGSVGNGNFFTSFWMERPYFDTAAAGLRIVANINSPSNNHHVILYQLGGLLWLDASNGTTNYRTSSLTNPALFGYGTHNVVIAFDNANQNARHIRVYVDNVLFIEANIGSMDLDFVNGGPDAPNDYANNYPRMALGGLITPFEITALTQYPSTLKTVYDEIVWANTTATPTIIAGLYNNMPTRISSFNEAVPALASALITESTVQTGTTISATPLLAFPAQTEPVITTEFSTTVITDSADATADINDAERSDSVNIVSDLFLATFALGFAGAPRVINATPLTASLALVNRTVTGVQTGQGNGILINGFRTFDPNSKWVQYVLSTTENNLIPMREVR